MTFVFQNTDIVKRLTQFDIEMHSFPKVLEKIMPRCVTSPSEFQ